MPIISEKIGCLVVDVIGKELSAEEREIIAHPLVGGIILFARNYESRKQIDSLCKQIRACRETPLLIMVDQEGGRVQRFIEEFTRLPTMDHFGKLFDQHPDKALNLTRDCGWLMAAELVAVGVDLSLAPVLDLNKGVSTVIGERAFHSNPARVIALATAFMQGMKDAGMSAVGKHFPGHGSVAADSHAAIPIDHRTLAEIESEDMQSFVGLIRAGIPGIMAAHIIFPEVDKAAVGFSFFWLKNILQTQLSFKGTIFTDDLNMEGANISTNYADRVLAAREAGCDFTLLCNNRQAVITVLDTLVIAQHQLDAIKWKPFLVDQSFRCDRLDKNNRWQHIRENLLNSFDKQYCT